MTEPIIISSFDVLEKIRVASLKDDGKENYMSSCIPSLDGFLTSTENGHSAPFVGGELVVLSGDEGEGKTLLSRSFTNSLESQDKHCLWFSYEETQFQFIKKFGERIPLFFLPDDLTGDSVDWIKSRYDDAVKFSGHIDAVFIDHLHYIADMSGKNNLASDIGATCRALKKFAVQKNIVIFLVVHTNRTDANDEPTNRSLRDSGMIGKEADTVLFIWRLDTENHAMLKGTKARGSGKKNFKVHLIKQGPFLKEFF